MITIATVPALLFAGDHLSKRYWQGDSMYEWGVSSGFNSAVWKVPGSTGGVRVGRIGLVEMGTVTGVGVSLVVGNLSGVDWPAGGTRTHAVNKTARPIMI
jgi:hypothetical protein